MWSVISGPSRKGSLTSEDSSICFNAASVDAKLQASDAKFANVIIQLIAPKLEEGHLSYLEGNGWGYTFSDDTVHPKRWSCTHINV